MKVSNRDLRGWVEEDVGALLPSHFFQDPVSSAGAMDGKVLTDSRRRWAAILSLQDGRRIFVKRDRSYGLIEGLKSTFLLSKGRKEWLISEQLRKKNLSVPRPLGWIEKRHRGLVVESYYLSQAIGPGSSVAEDIDRLKEEGCLQELAKTVRRIHDEGVLHLDFHAGNFLLEGERFFLIDLHRARIIKSLSLNQRLWGLSQLFHSLRSIWEIGEHRRFLSTYFEKEPSLLQREREFLQKIHGGMNRLQTRQWKSRTKRCIKESTDFSIIKEGRVRFFHRRSFPIKDIKNAVEEHLRSIREGAPEVMRSTPAISVSVLECGGNRICVKQFRYPSLRDKVKNAFRRSRGLRAWIGGNGLRARGIPSVALYGLVEKKGCLGLTGSYIVMEALPMARELDRYLVHGFRDIREKRRFIRRFAEWLLTLHEIGVYHRDMKTCNILVAGSGACGFYLIDLEDICLDRKVKEGKVLRNLVQLNGSIPRAITRTDRMRFLRRYLEGHPMKMEKKEMVKRILDETRRRGVVYVAPWGVVEENEDAPYRSSSQYDGRS